MVRNERQKWTKIVADNRQNSASRTRRAFHLSSILSSLKHKLFTAPKRRNDTRFSVWIPVVLSVFWNMEALIKDDNNLCISDHIICAWRNIRIFLYLFIKRLQFLSFVVFKNKSSLYSVHDTTKCWVIQSQDSC